MGPTLIHGLGSIWRRGIRDAGRLVYPGARVLFMGSFGGVIN